MAIIRIKRTTSSSLPTGLTFGELAFVGASGGATANRLYIAGPEGTCLWIGAQILNTPQIQYWSGVTAETTVPTVSAVESRVVAGGGVTFANNITVNIADGKFFGKYKKNDVILAAGQTVKWVIEDALQESIAPTVSLTTSSSISYGQTSGTITLSPSYTIKTAGASAAGTTLEFRYAGAANWTSLSTSLKNDSLGIDQPYNGSYPHTGWNRASDVGSGGTYGTTAFQYRWTVRDTIGNVSTVELNSGTGLAPQGTVNPSVTFSGVTAASLRTGVLGSFAQGTETNTYREKGNTYTTVTFTINAVNTFVPLTNYVLQSSERIGNSTSWSNWSNVKSEQISGTSVSRGLTYNPTNSSANLDAMRFRVQVNDLANSFLGTTFNTPDTSAQVFFDYLMFFGATANTTINTTTIRGLSSGIVAGNHNTTGGGANGGVGALSTTLTPIMSSANAVAATGPNSNTRFIVAVPDDVTLTTVNDIFLSNANITSAFNLSSTVTTVPDRDNNNKNYNVYIMSVTGYEDGVHTHTVQRSGTVTKP
jgi:hypothetical protein